MDFLEKDLEDIVFENSDEALSSRGYRISGKRFRQKVIGRYGICDLLTVDRVDPFGTGHCLMITIHEFKKDQVTVDTFMQALRYCKGISHYLNDRETDIPHQFKISLCGKRIDMESSFVYLADLVGGDGLDFSGTLVDLKVYSYTYDFDGIKFNTHSRYNLVEPGFNKPPVSRKRKYSIF